jgi:hypothetical protein
MESEIGTAALRRLYADTFLDAGQFLAERLPDVLEAIRVNVVGTGTERSLEVEAFGAKTSVKGLESDDELYLHVRTIAQNDAIVFVDDLSLAEPDPRWVTPLLTAANSMLPHSDDSTVRFSTPPSE